jgi:hypothetical protein
MKIEIPKDREFREGSMGAKENKGYNIARIVVGFVVLLIWLCFFVFNTYMNAAQERAGVAWGLFGTIFIVAAYLLFYFARSFTKPVMWGIIAGALLLFGLLVSIGFKGDISANY